MIRETPGIDFRPYDIDQIHATIIGLERDSGKDLVNKNMARYRGRRVVMDIVGFARDIQASSHFPIRLQFGGYAPGDVSFTSRGQPPCDRSFSIQGDKVVLIGWPASAKGQRRVGELMSRNEVDIDRSLDNIRKRAQAFNILHAYHASETDVDNDFYLRLGLVNTGGLTERRIQELNQKLRIWLSPSPLNFALSLHDLTIVSYQDEMLPKHSTRQFSIDRICRHKEEIQRLYSAWTESAK